MRKFKTLIGKNIIWYALLLILQIAYIVGFITYFAKELPILNIIIRAIALVFVLYILNRPLNPAYKIAWIIPILAFPIFGISVYLLLRRHPLSRRNRRLIAQSDKAIEHLLVQNQKTIKKISDPSSKKQAEKIYNSARAPAVLTDKTEYFDSGESYYEKLLSELQKAEKFIFIEVFIISEGALWTRIKDILEYKASRGVDVRLIYDDVGSQLSVSPHLGRELNRIGIKTYKFNPFKPFFNIQMNNRTHRKIVVIDGKTAFTGGANIGDEYVNLTHPYGHWKDAGIMFTGKGVDTFTLAFLKSWNMHREVKNYANYVGYAAEADNSSENIIIPFTDLPSDEENVSQDMYLQMIYGAQKYVYFFTPYLIIDDEMRTALITAKKSGVDVRVVVPHIPDKRLVFELTKVFYTELVENGIAVYEYTDGFIHSKVALSDDTKAYVGTCNLDYRSLFLHLECGVYVDSGSVCKKIKRDFESTFEKSREVKLSELKTGKLRSFWRSVLRMFAPLM